MKNYVLTVTWAAVLLSGNLAVAGKIDRTQDTTRSSSSSSNSRSSDDDDDDSSGSFVGAILRAIFSGDHDGESSSGAPSPYVRRDTEFHSYPYADRQPGIAVITRHHYSATNELMYSTVSPEGTEGGSEKNYSGAWQADYHYDWDNVHITTVRARLISAAVVGLDLKWSGLFEPVGNDEIDTAHMAELGLTFNRAISPRFVGRFGIGGHLMAFPGEDASVAFGGTGLLGFDFFPVRPLVFSAEMQIGYLDHALYFRGDGTVGVMVAGPLEVNAGYRVQSFTNGNSDNGVRYHGFTAGLRLWF